MTHDQPTLKTEQARFNMIEQQVRPWDVLDAQVLKLLSAIKREAFVPEAQRSLAFMDLEVRIGAHPNQVMLAPRVQARMLQDLQVKPTDRVLDIGTGSGFMAALLAASATSVLSLEIDPALAERAQATLLAQGLGNVTVRVADACKPLPEAAASFDVICINGSLAQVPDHLLDLLAPGGRLMAVVGNEPVMRATRTTRGAGLHTQALWDTVAPRLSGFAEPSRFSF